VIFGGSNKDARYKTRAALRDEDWGNLKGDQPRSLKKQGGRRRNMQTLIEAHSGTDSRNLGGGREKFHVAIEKGKDCNWDRIGEEVFFLVLGGGRDDEWGEVCRCERRVQERGCAKNRKEFEDSRPGVRAAFGCREIKDERCGV